MGPDHLSALATLSTMTTTTTSTESKKTTTTSLSFSWTSFWLGIRWGIGHSTGLILVGSVFIVLDVVSQSQQQQYDQDDDNIAVVKVPRVLSHVLDWFVGFFMLFLGLYGIRHAFYNRTQRRIDLFLLRQEQDNNNRNAAATSNTTTEQTADEAVYKEMDDDKRHYHSHHHHNALDVSSSERILPTMSFPTSHTMGVVETNYVRFGKIIGCSNTYTNTNTKTMALVAGIIHGLAGPGGVLGVIPAVQLHNWKLASLYLGSFCLSSTLTMGWFASIYVGTLRSFFCGGGPYYRREEKVGDSKDGMEHLEFRIQCISASLSLVVGILWLVLLSIGKLDVFFE
jgi:hypothetical protein